jgi:hypothetical protein
MRALRVSADFAPSGCSLMMSRVSSAVTGAANSSAMTAVTPIAFNPWPNITAAFAVSLRGAI